MWSTLKKRSKAGIVLGFLGVLLVAAPSLASAQSLQNRINDRLNLLQERLGERQQLLEERLEMQQERVCERLRLLNERVGSNAVPPFCDGDGGGGEEPIAPTLSFTANPEDIAEGESATLSWDADNADTCTASAGWSGEKGTSGEEEVSPSDDTTYTLTCEGEGGEVSKSVTVEVSEDEPEPEDPTLEFSAEPTGIDVGNSATLSWDSEHADSCTASDGWSGDKAVDGEEEVSPSEDTTYTLTCTGDGGEVTKSVTVEVNEDEPEPEDPTLSFSAEPGTIDEGATSTLSWNSENADTCTASDGWSGDKSVDGEEEVSPSEDTTYTLTCEGEGGEVVESVTVEVNEDEPEPEDPTLTFTADPETIEEGATSTLSWDSTNADSCVASNGWSGSKALDGEEVVSPTATTTYELECSGEGGTTTESVTVNVILTEEEPDAPTLVLSAEPGALTEAGTTTVSWDSENADTCTASDGWTGDRAVDGEEDIFIATTTTFSLECEGDGGTVMEDVTVVVDEEEPEPEAPTVTLAADPEVIDEGATSTLSWASENADSCIASGDTEFTGAVSVDGEEVVSPATTTEYTIVCEGEGGTATDTATVVVNEDEPEPEVPTLTFSADPETIEEGATSTLSWDSTNADSCVASNGWSGSKALDGEEVVSPTATTTYELECSGEGGTTTESVTINVALIDEEPVAPTLTMSAEPPVLSEAGTSTISWDSENTSECIASEGWSGTKALSGEEEVLVSTTTSYVLECVGDGGTTTESVIITVEDAEPEPEVPTLVFSAEPLSIEAGATSTLSWVSENADSCTASDGWSGDKTSSGEQLVEIFETTTYTLACENEVGTTTESVTITVEDTEPEPGEENLLISEVYYDVASDKGEESDNEWVEIYNAGTTTVNLAGYSLGSATSSIDIISEDELSLAPGAYLVIAADSGATTTSTFWDFGEVFVISLLSPITASGLSNSGDVVKLFNAELEEVDAVSYGENEEAFSPSVPDVSEGHSIARDPADTDTDSAADWSDETEPTPGLPVFTAPTEDADGIVISEVYFDVDDAHGAETANEWIELYNAGDVTVDLAGWSVGDASDNVDMLSDEELLLAPGEYMIVAADTSGTSTADFWGGFSDATHVVSLGSSISGGLANGGDSVRLFDDVLAEIDAVGYGSDTEVFASGQPDAAEGNSISRDPRDNDTDLGSDWIEEEDPNPGS